HEDLDLAARLPAPDFDLAAVPDGLVLADKALASRDDETVRKAADLADRADAIFVPGNLAGRRRAAVGSRNGLPAFRAYVLAALDRPGGHSYEVATDLRGVNGYPVGVGAVRRSSFDHPGHSIAERPTLAHIKHKSNWIS